MIRPVFRNAFYAGALVAVVVGLYLFQIWQPDRQVHLHSVHLATALEQKDWGDVSEFLARDYGDQWGHDRETVMMKLQQVLHYARNLRIDAQQTITSAADGEGRWIASIRIEADGDEVAAFIKERVNVLDEPFELNWRRQSWKPWDWQLVRVNNPALEMPTGSGF